MSDTIKIGIELNSNTTEETAKVKQLNKEIEQTKKLAAETKIGGSTAAGRAASQSSYARKEATGSTDREDFRVARAGVGTGAEGRDFAKQAQGLGGLVHVYATFAANIFAVTAAFTALDKAYSFIRLEKAADIMSNRIGFSVNGLSRDLVTATDHAISFQEAMQFSNVGIAAGLTGKQITDLTIMAKGAANALGRDMGDAVRRMIQGTAKQEQEILDELGIFIKAKNAYADYAKKIGVGVDELTAQQRVNAYADAVAKAGEKWKEFAVIEDPFSKFVATGKEAAIEILNVVNSIVTPIINLIAHSKVAMEGLIVGLTAVLLSKALPGMRGILTDFFTVDKSGIDKKLEEHRQVLLSGFNKTKAELESQQATSKTKSESLSTDKEQSLLDAKTAKHAQLLKSYDAEIEKKIVINKLDKVDTSLSNTKGLNSTIFRANIANPAFKADLDNQESILKVMQATVQQQIRSGSEDTRNIALKKAIASGLVEQKSTLDNIVLSQQTRNKVTSAILEKQVLSNNLALDAEAAQLKIAESKNQLDLLSSKLSEKKLLNEKLLNASKEQELAISKQLLIVNSEIMGIEETRKSYAAKPTTKAGETARAGFASINLDLGQSGVGTTLPTIIPKFTEMWKETEGPMNKATLGLKMFGFVGSLAVRGILAAMGPLMLAWTAIDLVIKPILYGVGYFSEAQDKAAEASKRLGEEAVAAYYSIARLNAEEKKVATGEEYTKLLDRKGIALRAQKDALEKYMEEANKPRDTKGKIVEPETRVAGTRNLTNLFMGELKSGPIQYMEGMLASLEKGSVGYNKLKEATINLAQAQEMLRRADPLDSHKQKMAAIDAEQNGLAIAHSLNVVQWSDNEKLISQQSESFGKFDSGINGIKEYIKKTEELPSKAIRAYGITDSVIAKHFQEQVTGLNNISKMKSGEGKTADIKVMQENTIELMKNLGDTTQSSTDRVVMLFGLLGAGPNPAALQELITKMAEIDKKAQDRAKTDRDEQKNFQLAQEGRTLEIDSLKHALKLTDEKLAIEEKALGYKTEATLVASTQQNIDIATKENQKTIFDIERKRKELGDTPKANANANIALANAKKVMDYTIETARAKEKLDRGTSHMQQYDLGAGADLKRQQDTIDNLNKIADINGLLSESDKIKLESSSAIAVIEAQITKEKEHQKDFIGTPMAGVELSKSNKLLEDLNQKKRYQVDLEASKLAKKDRDDLIKDNVTKLKLYDLQLAKLHESSATNFKGIEAAAIRQKIASAEEEKMQGEIAKILRDEHAGTMRDVLLQTHLIEVRKKGEEDYKAQLLDRQKNFSNLDNSGKWQTAIDIIGLEAKNFEKTLTPVITTVFKGIYGGMDAAIDTLTTKWMKGEKFVLRDVAIAFRNAIGEQFRSAAADQMKMAGRQMMQAGSLAMASILKIPGLDPNSLQTQDQKIIEMWNAQLAAETKSYDALAAIKTATETMATASYNNITSGANNVASQMGGGNNMGIAGNAAPVITDTSGLGASFTSVAKQAGNMIGSSIGGGGIAGKLIGGGISAGISPAWDMVKKLFGFANGGIMSSSGAMPLHAYASGGVASTPQLALFGEGRMNEAYVPLPDGRSIPVTMKSPGTTSNSANGPVSISVQVNTTTGQTNTQAKGGSNTDAMAQFGNIIAQKVREEIIQQSRPNGLLNR